jgi:hypothetical protein
MSVTGQTRRFRDVREMSGLPLNSRHFRTRSALRICANSGHGEPLDHLVVAVWLTIQGARREGLRHLEEV